MKAWAWSKNWGGNEFIDSLSGESARHAPSGRPRMCWEDNIKIGLGDIGYEDGRWMELVYVRVIWRFWC
jgi:hypothetical protein